MDSKHPFFIRIIYSLQGIEHSLCYGCRRLTLAKSVTLGCEVVVRYFNNVFLAS
jgi:hypothetical protein